MTLQGQMTTRKSDETESVSGWTLKGKQSDKRSCVNRKQLKRYAHKAASSLLKLLVLHFRQFCCTSLYALGKSVFHKGIMQAEIKYRLHMLTKQCRDRDSDRVDRCFLRLSSISRTGMSACKPAKAWQQCPLCVAANYFCLAYRKMSSTCL